ncbi:MAG: hypothetical protein U0R26_08835 [Solirubrobacterales bacterium]
MITKAGFRERFGDQAEQVLHRQLLHDLKTGTKSEFNHKVDHILTNA